MKYKYGITWDQYEAKYNAQEGKCNICGIFYPLYDKKKENTLVIDHCHETGKIRDLLCFSCNAGIGALKEDPEIFIKALNYIFKHRNEKDKCN